MCAGVWGEEEEEGFCGRAFVGHTQGVLGMSVCVHIVCAHECTTFTPSGMVKGGGGGRDDPAAAASRKLKEEGGGRGC